jgi:PBP1b-binding outer membrane lipoprotein LpoB
MRTVKHLLLLAFLILILQGCVRVAGGAGYWHTNPEGGTTAKQVGFDSADYVPGSSAPGKITV